MEVLDPLDRLDASLQDFEPTTPPMFPRKKSGIRQDHDKENLPPPINQSCRSRRSGFHSDEDPEEEAEEDDQSSVGGYSPPAWRRLGNGDRSSGFWRRSDAESLMREAGSTRPSTPGLESDLEDDDLDIGDVLGADDEILRRAIKTRLPTGSLSPEKGRSPEPERMAAVGIGKRLAVGVRKGGGRESLGREATPGDNCKLPLSFATNCNFFARQRIS